jgi:hypothetical protein
VTDFNFSLKVVGPRPEPYDPPPYEPAPEPSGDEPQFSPLHGFPCQVVRRVVVVNESQRSSVTYDVGYWRARKSWISALVARDGDILGCDDYFCAFKGRAGAEHDSDARIEATVKSGGTIVPERGYPPSPKQA